MRFRKERDFVSRFNENTGVYFRSGVFKDGKETEEDPFMASFPELLDVGIMGHCVHGKSGLCMKAGIECYQNGLTRQDQNMPFEQFKRIVEECKGNTYQIALGGCGDPDQHGSFKKIVKLCRDNGIVPNFTTSGLGMTPEIAKICKEYCGAVAVSWYRNTYTLQAIQRLKDAGVKTNIHYVLNNNTIAEALERLRNHTFPDVNAIIFLLHKPVGQGTQKNVIQKGSKEFREFVEYVSSMETSYKIGFDSCTVPALVNNMGQIDPSSLDTCEGARWSAYISADMQMMPCSFDNDAKRWAVDLHTHTIQEAWNSPQFEDFRDHFRNACPGCDKRNACMGGCPICPEVVLCERKATTK